MHRIFVNRHGFADPPANSKVIADCSFAAAAFDNNVSQAATLNTLVGPARFFTTKCIMDEILATVGPNGLLPDLKVLRCRHSTKTNDSRECLILQLGRENPRSFMIATMDNLHLADTVHGLPVITYNTQHAAVFRAPSQSQVEFADGNSLVVIREKKKEDLTRMERHENNLRLRSKKRGSR